MAERRSWEDIGKRAAKIKSRGKVLRFLRSSRDAQMLSDLADEINNSILEKVMVREITLVCGCDA